MTIQGTSHIQITFYSFLSQYLHLSPNVKHIWSISRSQWSIYSFNNVQELKGKVSSGTQGKLLATIPNNDFKTKLHFESQEQNIMVWIWNAHICLCFEYFVYSWWYYLLYEVVETLGSETLLETVHHWHGVPSFSLISVQRGIMIFLYQRHLPPYMGPSTWGRETMSWTLWNHECPLQLFSQVF